ncbi:gliding motility lipoprotein GldB [Seonamhaeicola sp. S2-3]|uniref:gliding motility lipoprotein GldB n=1 Tax=Seonamhaeicola sp. S2-3 TaxID=1936081 RepID=UPI000972A6C5|nr:gliding motility lipoprotein GldB [Seonamhaeicola sp. S2-3]APY10322.1 gliding motility lipoprotein GldB [Seonamhaeicola sp. S2-3]
MKNLLLFLLLAVTVYSCKKNNQLEADIAQINIDVEVERFDQFFAETNAETLPKLKKAYPFMFSKKYKDSFWLAKINDTLQQMLSSEVNKTFSNFSDTEAEIESLFNHIKYYFEAFNPPRVITTTSDVDYRNRVIVTDTIAIIALDNYLGSNHEFYTNIPKYIKSHFKKEQIVVDLATEYAKKYIHQAPNKTLLDEMIYFGKQLYFKDVIIPFKTEAQRIGYTKDELNWANINESDIWRYFVERELLFSTDSKLPSRFINPAPFTKFYLEDIDANSPGRLGQYIGWKMVRAYMNQNKVSLKKMLITSAEEIYNNTKYKPNK